MRAAEHQNDTPHSPQQAADKPLPEARVSPDQLQAARRIVEREMRELRAQLARDTAALAATREGRPS